MYRTFWWSYILLDSFCSKPSQQVILDYDYTFTTPYSGSGTVQVDDNQVCIPSTSLLTESIILDSDCYL